MIPDLPGRLLEQIKQAMDESVTGKDESAASTLTDVIQHLPASCVRLRVSELQDSMLGAALWTALGDSRHRMGFNSLALQAYEQALNLNPREPGLLQHMILCYDCEPGATWEGAQALRRLWVERFACEPKRMPIQDPDPERVIRVGFSSPDFQTHSAANCFAGAVLHHSERMEVYCYSDTSPEAIAHGLIAETNDPEQPVRVYATDIFKRQTNWRDTYGLSGRDWRKRIEEDRIDILIECAGFTPHGRLRDLSRRCAPIQVSAWGYATGTGVPAVDYFLADPVAIPPEARGWFTEEIVDLPCLIGYYPAVHPDRLGETLKVGPLPALGGWLEIAAELASGKECHKNGIPIPFTFASLNRVTKHNAFVWGLWAKILHAVPHGRLLLKSEGWEEPARRWGLSSFEQLGIDPGRILIEGKTKVAEHLARYHQVDLALDPHPHGGGVSSAEALMMGVPVVTLLGEVATSRVTASLETVLGLEGFIARTQDEYVDLAVGWTRRLEELSRIRVGLRERFFASAIWGERYGPHVEAALRSIWNAACTRASALLIQWVFFLIVFGGPLPEGRWIQAHFGPFPDQETCETVRAEQSAAWAEAASVSECIAQTAPL